MLAAAFWLAVFWVGFGLLVHPLIGFSSPFIATAIVVVMVVALVAMIQEAGAAWSGDDEWIQKKVKSRRGTKWPY